MCPLSIYHVNEQCEGWAKGCSLALFFLFAEAICYDLKLDKIKLLLVKSEKYFLPIADKFIGVLFAHNSRVLAIDSQGKVGIAHLKN
ncbi:hypothetical protein MNBD_GAMMA10-562 [hydrothermal vent metagenome]|uniref:Uncharacterized protein n=1 Tax=hydrothermal vent metagenome TaxID=652676 RepID=A0A3B0Y7N6_9ZZZZ